ncbi:MAG TPA: carboxypeptidase-like regulatory domain-containing protein [Longimicrobiaceae bacterium]|nr:carboxypeptidase-like regulatory domain-containing protein [Longimicrobiaceae bacterium]
MAVDARSFRSGVAEDTRDIARVVEQLEEYRVYLEMPKLTRLLLALVMAAALAPGAAPATAQTARAVIRGRVVDATTGEAIPAAKLEIPDRHRSVYTDRDGHFELPALPPGSYDLNVGQLGYYQQRLTLGITRDDSLVFRLSPQTVLLEELRVYGSRLAERAARASIAGRAFDAERLKVATSGSILSFLETDGGLFLLPCSERDATRGCARVRGMPEPVAVYVDGLPALGGLDDLRDIPPGEVFHVNVYGGGSVVEVFTRRYASLESHRSVIHLLTPGSMPRAVQLQRPIGGAPGRP